MAKNSIHIDVSELVAFGDNLVDERKRKMYLTKILELEGNALLKRLIKNTPVDTGNLQNHWTNDNPTIQVKEVAGGFEIALVNKAADEKGRMYGSWVDQGHRAIPGQFIPPLGKRIKQTTTWVEGKFFVDKSIMQMEDNDLKHIVKVQLQEWLEGCLVNG